mmetsp:Transcript_3321/g.9610  ORF Transcript_3321/g.9610 Transcript_3321/m.9610 type:complete len:877 (-) Transcript_3321:642-3272(-)
MVAKGLKGLCCFGGTADAPPKVTGATAQPQQAAKTPLVTGEAQSEKADIQPVYQIAPAQTSEPVESKVHPTASKAQSAESKAQPDGLQAELESESPTDSVTPLPLINANPSNSKPMRQLSGEILVKPPRPGKFTADASAGLPTVAGQRRARLIANGTGSLPNTPKSSGGKRDLRTGSVPVSSNRTDFDGLPVKSFDFMRSAASGSLYDLPIEALYAEAAADAQNGEKKDMMNVGAPILAEDQNRVDKLCSLGVTPEADQRFDDITRLVTTIFRAPIALVSLVEQERQWFKSVVGLQVKETPRSTSFCAWTLIPVNPEVLVVENATLDPRFRDNPLVTGPPHIRFYAGAPLVTAEGYRLGSLCVIDPHPRTFDVESCNLLCNFAEMVVREIEKEKLRVSESVKLQSQTNSLMRAMDAFNEAIMLVDMEEGRWTVMFTNDAWLRFMNSTREQAVGADLWSLFEQPDARQEATMQAAQVMVAAKQEFALELAFRDANNGLQRVTAKFRPAANEALDNMPQIGIPGFVPWKSKLPNYFFATVQMKATSTLDRMLDDVMLSGSRNRRLGSSSIGSGGSIGSASGGRWRPQLIAGHKEPFEDVQLGPLLGKGSFGRVYRAMWNGVPVAVKVIETPIAKGNEGQEAKPMFEAERGTSLSHPHVVQTFKSHTALSKTDGKPYQETWLLLEFCDRGSLQDAMDRGAFRPVRLGEEGSKADIEAIFATAKEIAAGMAYLHADNVLHGDLTAGNILLTSSPKDSRQFTSKIADFGLSRVLLDTSVSTGTYGTVTHMPPELLTTGRLSKGADTYAFGVLLWEMFTGQRPWGGMLQMQIVFNITVAKKTLEFPADAPEDYQVLISTASNCLWLQQTHAPLIVASFIACT